MSCWRIKGLGSQSIQSPSLRQFESSFKFVSVADATSMVAPSAPRDARPKTPPGPEGSNGIGRCGCRGQPAGPSPFMGCAHESQSSLRKPGVPRTCSEPITSVPSVAISRRPPESPARPSMAGRSRPRAAVPRKRGHSPPPGPEGSNGIGRCGCRGQPAGPSPLMGCAHESQGLRSKPWAPGTDFRSPRLRRAPLPRGLCSSRYAGGREDDKSHPCLPWR